jgi:uncharacterized protein (TIGR02594 family)
MTESAPVVVEPPWVRIARGEIGQAEHLPGGNPRIAEYRAIVGAAPGENWCAAFMAWVLTQAGYTGPWNAAARSFLHVGEPLSEFRPGCIAVLWRVSPQDWRGHVTLCLRDGIEQMTLLGGNQNGAVRISKYPKARLLGWRWPT